MILYLLRFSLSLFFFFLFYKLILEKEKTFHFNRFFLLAGLLFSLMVPMISLEGPESFKTALSATQQDLTYEVVRWEEIFTYAYLGITGVLLIRFLLDLKALFRKAREGEQKILSGEIIILTEEEESPNAFYRFVFINKNLFNHIAPDLLEHELTHVKQRHTYDILFIEVLKTLFWFNPLLAAYKRCMQLNHEFLADKSAVEVSGDPQAYQATLLDFVAGIRHSTISSGFNFLAAKKRLTMLNKPSAGHPLWKQLFALPLVAFVLFACSDHAGVSGKEMLHYWRYTASMEEILKTGTMDENDLREGVVLPIENREQYDELKDIYNRMNSAQKESVYELPPYLEPIPSEGD